MFGLTGGDWGPSFQAVSHQTLSKPMSSSAKPVIGVISCNRTVDDEPAYTVKSRYVDAVWRHADAVPLICPSIADASDAESMVARLDAILLTGSSSNIEPSRYGAASGRAPFDPGRDGMAAALIAAAMTAGKPVFGICRGLQEINVALGGTLKDQRDAPGADLQHHAPDDADLEAMFGHGHVVTALADTPMARIAGAAALAVNSVHYQSIDGLGQGLMVNARAADGVVEAVSSLPGAAPILAVQWHPEWRPEERAHDLAFWREVGRMSREAMRR